MLSSNGLNTIGIKTISEWNNLPILEQVKKLRKANLSIEETFDISGKIDTSNPIYKFYESDVAKFLKNQFNAKPVIDPQGVKWMEIDIKPEMKNEPVKAFGARKQILPYA
jgi:hypothetical protein